MKEVYAYLRISDKYKQSDGASLTEQKRIIKEFAKKNKLKIVRFYEESKTAAKQGRPLFDKMIQNLKANEAQGVIIHKIDRSARNLHDWANIGDLIDMNIDVFFAHESLNLNERSGRLSADIQAVMASDYVRNLRQEILKGMYGRLKQGLYPWGAPIGYLDTGRGKPKTVDPIQGELVKTLFELYRTGNYNVLELSKEMEKRGLKNQNGNRVCKNGIVRMLKNPFYVGIIKVKGKTFSGIHETLIDSRLFEQVQKILKGRNRARGLKHFYLFRKLVRCNNCNYVMSGELQKGRVYYRCKTKGCYTKCIREDTIEHYVNNILKSISLSKSEIIELNEMLEDRKSDSLKIQAEALSEYKLKIGQLESKEQKLVDAYLDGILEKEEFQKRKESLLFEMKKLEEQKNSIEASDNVIFDKIRNFVELCKSPLKTYVSAIQEEKRELVEIISSNLTIDGRKALFSTVSPFYELANRDILSLGDPKLDTSRIPYGKIVYADKNTSPIIPKPMNKQQTETFFQFLLSSASTLSRINKFQNYYEIPTNNTNS